MQRPHERRQCKAQSKQTGRRCGNAPIIGGLVCRFHGGGAPQVKVSARERIDALVDPSITQLGRIVENGESDAVKLAAIKDVLDRAGYKPVDKRENKIEGNLTVDGLREALGV